MIFNLFSKFDVNLFFKSPYLKLKVHLASVEILNFCNHEFS